MRLLGISNVDIQEIALSKAKEDQPFGLMTLSRKDRSTARSGLEKGDVASDSQETAELKSQLRTMMVLNIKAEIQVMSRCTGGLEKWLSRRIQNAPSG